MLPQLADVVALARDLRCRYTTLRAELHRLDHAIQRTDPRDPRRARPRCGARTRAGGTCKAPAVWLPGELDPRRRCRLHGGLSTGPRTVEGLRRSLANLRGVDPSAAPSLRQATGALGFGSGRCGVCAARARVNAPALARAARESRPVAPGELLCAACTAALQRAQGRSRLAFTARW